MQRKRYAAAERIFRKSGMNLRILQQYKPKTKNMDKGVSAHCTVLHTPSFCRAEILLKYSEEENA